MKENLRQLDEVMVFMRNHRIKRTRVASLNLFGKIKRASRPYFLNEIHRCQAEQNRHEEDNCGKNHDPSHKKSYDKDNDSRFKLSNIHANMSRIIAHCCHTQHFVEKLFRK